jgi:hypothetical protein
MYAARDIEAKVWGTKFEKKWNCWQLGGEKKEFGDFFILFYENKNDTSRWLFRTVLLKYFKYGVF